MRSDSRSPQAEASDAVVRDSKGSAWCDALEDSFERHVNRDVLLAEDQLCPPGVPG